MTEGISVDPEVIGGKPRVEGTRVSVEQIYEMYKIHDVGPEEIADILPTVEEDEVRKAIRYAEEQGIETEKTSEKPISKS